MISNVPCGQAECAPPPTINLPERPKRSCLFAAGATIFQQGETGDAMYVVTAGEVAVIRDGKRIAICGVGELVGELAALDGQPRSATAVAYTDCVLVVIDRRTFEFLLRAVPAFAPQVMRTLTTRLRRYQGKGAPNAQPAPWRTITTRLQGSLLPGAPRDEELAAPCPID